MNLKVTVLFLCSLLSPLFLYARNEVKENKFQPANRHEIRISFSDGIPLSMANFLGTGLADAFTGTRHDNSESHGLFGIGYRYGIDRWKFGMDFSFGNTTCDITSVFKNMMPVRRNNLNFLVMPTGEMVYFKRGLVELYGSAALGVLFERTVYDVYHEEQTTGFFSPAYTSYPSDFSASLAFQVNPIAIRVGNERIGGFLEGGVGYKGFVTAGISIRF